MHRIYSHCVVQLLVLLYTWTEIACSRGGKWNAGILLSIAQSVFISCHYRISMFYRTACIKFPYDHHQDFPTPLNAMRFSMFSEQGIAID